jgi:hypothetical protein
MNSRTGTDLRSTLRVLPACGGQARVGFFPASRLLKNAHKQFLRGAARPGLKPRVYIGFIAADLMSELKLRPPGKNCGRAKARPYNC